MTEAEWLCCADLPAMIEWLNERDASARKLRLFSCACARSLWDLFSQDEARAAVSVAEEFADERKTEPERLASKQALRALFPRRMTPDYPVPVSYAAGIAAYYCLWTNPVQPGPGIHLNEHGAESVSHWTRRTLVLHQTGLWEYAPN